MERLCAFLKHLLQYMHAAGTISCLHLLHFELNYFNDVNILTIRLDLLVRLLIIVTVQSNRDILVVIALNCGIAV